MALLSSLEPLDASTDTVADLVTTFNVIVEEMRNNVVTANNSLANTNGNARINGMFVSNTSYVIDGLSVSDTGLAVFESGNTTILLNNTDGITTDFTVTGEAFASPVTVQSVNATAIVVSEAPTESRFYAGFIDPSANDILFFTRFGLSGGVPDSDPQIDDVIDHADLYIVSNTIFTKDANLVTIEANLQVDTDSLFLGNVQAQSTVQFANNESYLEFKGANQDFVWTSTNTVATVRTDEDGSLEISADVGANSADASKIELRVDDLPVAQFNEGGDVAFYDANGTSQLLVWDADNLTLGVNTGDPQVNVALDVVGNTHTLDLNVANQTTSGNVVVNDELRGNNTLFVTTDTEFTNSANQVLIRNDLFVEGDAQISQDLTVNTDSLFVGNVEAQSTIEFTRGNSTLKFAGANQDFIWDSSNTQSTIRTNANGSLIIDADKTDNGAGTSRIDLRVDNKTSARIEDDHIAFYNKAGTAKRLYWDADNLTLGVNVASNLANVALHVAGNTQTTDLLVIDDATIGNDLTVGNDTTVGNNLQVDSSANVSVDLTVGNDTTVGNNLQVDSSANVGVNLNVVNDTTIGNDLTVGNDTTVGTNLTVTANTTTGNLAVTNSVLTNLTPNTTLAYTLGNTTFQWLQLYAQDADFSGNVNIDGDVNIGGNTTIENVLTTEILDVSNSATIDTLTVQNLTVPGDGNIELPLVVNFTGNTTFENIVVTGTADISLANVSSISTEDVGIIGGFANVISNATTPIDTFHVTEARGFKYIIHGTIEGNPSAVFGIEINCVHNGSTVFFTRYGELSEQFDCDIEPTIVGNDVRINVTCPNASPSNQHSFKFLRIDTR